MTAIARLVRARVRHSCRFFGRAAGQGARGRRELSAIASEDVKRAAPGSRATIGVMTESTSLWTLFASSFLAATLLPGGSEFVFAAILKANPHLYWPTLVVATLGNTL